MNRIRAYRAGDALAMMLCACAGANAQATFTVVSTGAQVPCQPSALSGDGLTLVGSGNFKWAPGVMPWRWSPGTGMQALSTTMGGAAKAVSYDGSVVGVVGDGPLVYRWAGGVLTLIPDGTVHPRDVSGLSRDGLTFVGSGLVGSYTRAYRWTQAGGTEELPLLPGFVQSSATGVSGDGGTVVGWVALSTGLGAKAFRWNSATGMQELPGLPGRPNGSASGISADGRVAVGGYHSAGGTDTIPIVWTADGGVRGLPLPPGAVSAVASRASADGSVITGTGITGSAGTAPFVWTLATGTRDMAQAIATHGAQVSAQLSESARVSENGRTFGGRCSESGYSRAWVATLPATFGCYANCDTSSIAPALDANDFACYLARFQAGEDYANCDGSTTPPTLNVADFVCFINRFAGGCS